MLVGTFERSIDNKGRIMIPSKFRGNFTNSIFLYPGFEPNTIYAASEEEIHNMMGSVPNPNLLNEKFRKLSQMIYGSGQLVDIDDQGRIQINIQILEQFGIKDKVVIRGLGTQFTITSKENFEKSLLLNNQENLSKLANEVSEKK